MNGLLELFGYTPKEAACFALFMTVGFLGTVIHWAKRWLREQTKSGLITYLAVNWEYTVMSGLTYFAAMAGLLSIGTIEFCNSQSLGLAFTAGYMIDSVVNKDAEK